MGRGAGGRSAEGRLAGVPDKQEWPGTLLPHYELTGPREHGHVSLAHNSKENERRSRLVPPRMELDP